LLKQNNYVEMYNNYEHLNLFDNAAKYFNILTISLNVLYNYFDGPNKIIFRSVLS